MTYYNDLTTLYAIKLMVGSTETKSDMLYSDLIRSASREIELIAHRHFVPRVETRVYDVPGAKRSTAGWNDWDDWGVYDERKIPPGGGDYLKFDDDVLEVSSLTNGDSTAIASSSYVLEPANDTPKVYLILKPSSGVAWLPTSAGEYRQAISAVLITGWHDDYSNAWAMVDTLGAAISTTTATSLTTTTKSIVHKGELLKIDTEFVYVSDTPTDSTATIVRGVNGSTAATHSNGASIVKWDTPALEMLCRTAVVAYQNLKNNPVGETINVGGYSFTTPKDVTKYIEGRLQNISLEKLGIG